MVSSTVSVLLSMAVECASAAPLFSQSQKIPEMEAPSNSKNVQYQETNVILTYLPQDLSEKTFKQFTSAIGPLKSCKLVQKKIKDEYVNLGYGFADYERPEDAAKAISVLNGLRIQHKTIKVTYARKSSPLIKGSNIYVRNVPRKMKEDELRNIFSQFGTIINIRILYDSLDKYKVLSKGVAFVRYNTSIEAHQAMTHLNGVMLPYADEPLCLREANRKQLWVDEAYSYMLYVTNFPMQWSKSIIFDKFAKYAPVTDVKLFMRTTGPYALVTITGYNNALKAINALNGIVFDHRHLVVAFKAFDKQSV